MLEQLFGSKTRVKLLQFFLNNPSQPYYLRELTRKLKTQLNSVRREVSNLEELGIIKSVQLVEPVTNRKKSKTLQQSGSRKYFLADTSFLLYPELKSLLIKDQLLLERNFVAKVEKLAKLKLLILTGVFVGLDGFVTDILVVGSINRKLLATIVRSFEREVGHSINYTVMTQQEFKYRHDITDKFLYDILEGKKIVIVDKLTGL